MRKVLAVGIIGLFIGIAFFPSFNALSISEGTNISDDKLIEIKVGISNIGGERKHTVWLTQEESDSLDILIEDFKEKLDNSESLEETSDIHYDMIISLNELGLLPDDIDVTNSDTLLSDIYGYGAIAKIFDIFINIANYKFFRPDNMGVNSNYFCFVSGETRNTKKGFHRIGIGFHAWEWHRQIYWGDTGFGWLHTDGKNGNVSWNDDFNGATGREMFGGLRMHDGHVSMLTFREGIFGFFGITIRRGRDKYYYQGWAYEVKIDNLSPPI